MLQTAVGTTARCPTGVYGPGNGLKQPTVITELQQVEVEAVIHYGQEHLVHKADFAGRPIALTHQPGLAE